MHKHVILFLTSPNSWDRNQMCLTNFKQLEKLGFDIITLTTSDTLPDYIYNHSKLVIHDYGEHKCRKKYYREYKEKTGGGYFFYSTNSVHTVRFFHETHFPSLLRNTITLVNAALSFDYEKYFYIEDDHYIHDDDLIKVHNYFNQLGEHNDLLVFTFRRSLSYNEMVYCSYMHFGKPEKMSKVMQNFAYTEYEFVNSDPNIYLHFYEAIFYRLINIHKNEDLNVLDINESISSVFNNSQLNRVYNYHELDDDVRCNIIYNHETKRPVFYYDSNSIEKITNIKVLVGGVVQDELDLYPGCWYVYHLDNELINKTEVVLNNSVKKSFKNLSVSEVINNGELCQ
jgi:hypothetical protein